MGWPNSDPEGWSEVERDAVRIWMAPTITVILQLDLEHQKRLLYALQAEEPSVFQSMLDKVSPATLAEAEADYLESKFSTGGA